MNNNFNANETVNAVANFIDNGKVEVSIKFSGNVRCDKVNDYCCHLLHQTHIYVKGCTEKVSCRSKKNPYIPYKFCKEYSILMTSLTEKEILWIDELTHKICKKFGVDAELVLRHHTMSDEEGFPKSGSEFYVSMKKASRKIAA